MIPGDVVSRLQLTADAAVGRVPSIQQVSDALAQLVPGQRVLAEIQALLPNGAYRALINQRDVTLALPFAAKAGDSLELEVIENEGKLVLAAVSPPPPKAGGKAEAGPQPAVETTLSRTGSFIASIAVSKDDGKPATPAPLNAQQPVAPAPPQKGADLVPLLKQAIGNSGMFYESHQSQWVGAQRSLESLLVEPQGRLSPRLEPQAPPTLTPRPMGTPEAQVKTAPLAAPAVAETAVSGVAQQERLPAAPATTATFTPTSQLVAPDLVPLVQQQLEALATQTYVWQGQAWPGQAMRWEIDEEANPGRNSGEEEVAPWQTRLTLTMPSLGEVRAALRLRGGEVTLALTAGSPEAEARLSGGYTDLRSQLETAGLAVATMTVGRHDRLTEQE